MSAKRKDKKGRVLRTGESQRKDLTYQYRYQDITGKRRTVYAPTLEELRVKEEEINNAGNVTVLELLERYISLKQGVRNATKVGYNFVFNLVKKEDFGHRKIRDIKTSDAKLWLMKQQKDGRGYSTITSVRGVVKPAFQMAHAGMDIKSLQYLMGHSDAGVTMNVYTHATYDHAEATMQKILQLHLPEEERKSG